MTLLLYEFHDFIDSSINGIQKRSNRPIKIINDEFEELQRMYVLRCTAKKKRTLDISHPGDIINAVNACQRNEG